MAIFSKCEVAAGPHGKQVVATAPVDPGTALVIDEEVIFAVECQHMQARCALCCCVCEEEVTGVACKACDARCARDPALQRWADAAQLLGPAQGSVALCALVFDILRRASHGTPGAAALGALRGLGSVHTYGRPVHLGAAVVDVNLDDPAALAAAFARAADAPTLGAMLDVPGLARTRRRFRRRGDDRAVAAPCPKSRGVKRPRA